MLKLEKLKTDLEDICTGRSAALWFSGGKDSRLLLEAAVSTELQFFVFRFDDGWTREQKTSVLNVLAKHKLPVYSYPPRALAMFGDGENLTVAAAYAVGQKGEIMPVLRDVVGGTACMYDVPKPCTDRAFPPVQVDLHIMGSKKRDRHYAFGDNPVVSGEAFSIGTAEFNAPLFEWSDEEVVAALKVFGIDYVEPSDQMNTGNISACSACLRGAGKVFCPKEQKEIDSVDWSPQQILAEWRELNNVRF